MSTIKRLLHRYNSKNCLSLNFLRIKSFSSEFYGESNDLKDFIYPPAISFQRLNNLANYTTNSAFPLDDVVILGFSPQVVFIEVE